MLNFGFRERVLFLCATDSTLQQMPPLKAFFFSFSFFMIHTCLKGVPLRLDQVLFLDHERSAEVVEMDRKWTKNHESYVEVILLK